MIDPKFNKLPVETADDLESDSASELTDEQRTERATGARQGLSINDTIAGDASLSVGSRGVDTSGVRSGSGAGSGMTNVTPGNGGSPAPNIVPGARGSGTTPLGSASSEESPTSRVDTGTSAPTADEIAARAHQCWHERGCPVGSPEVDWHRAEQELRAERQQGRATGAAAGGAGL